MSSRVTSRKWSKRVDQSSSTGWISRRSSVLNDHLYLPSAIPVEGEDMGVLAGRLLRHRDQQLPVVAGPVQRSAPVAGQPDLPTTRQRYKELGEAPIYVQYPYSYKNEGL